MKPARFVRESVVYGRRTFALMEDSGTGVFVVVCRTDTITDALRVRDALDASDEAREREARLAEWRENQKSLRAS